MPIDSFDCGWGDVQIAMLTDDEIKGLPHNLNKLRGLGVRARFLRALSTDDLLAIKRHLRPEESDTARNASVDIMLRNKVIKHILDRRTLRCLLDTPSLSCVCARPPESENSQGDCDGWLKEKEEKEHETVSRHGLENHDAAPLHDTLSLLTRKRL